jgi:hypothetical protein
LEWTRVVEPREDGFHRPLKVFAVQVFQFRHLCGNQGQQFKPSFSVQNKHPIDAQELAMSTVTTEIKKQSSRKS